MGLLDRCACAYMCVYAHEQKEPSIQGVFKLSGHKSVNSGILQPPFYATYMACLFVFVHVSVQAVHECLRLYVCACMCVYMQVPACVLQLCMLVCMFVCACLCDMCLYESACVYVYVHALCSQSFP